MGLRELKSPAEVTSHFNCQGATEQASTCQAEPVCPILMCSQHRSPHGPLQVLGHSKTILVLLGGWLFLGDSATGRKLLGMGLAVAGMVW